MELSELTAYAEEKFHMQEQHNWSDFPGFSVLADSCASGIIIRERRYRDAT